MIRLFRVFIPVGTLTVLLCELFLLTASFLAACYAVLPYDPTIWLTVDGGWLRIAMAVGTLVVGIHFHDLYSRIRVQSRLVLLQQLCMVVGVGFLLQGTIAYLDPDLRVPIRVMVAGSFLSLAAVFTWRVFFSDYALRAVGGERMLLVGTSPLLAEIAEHISLHPETGMEVLGYVTNPEEADYEKPGGKILGDLSRLTEIVNAVKPFRIVVGMFERRGRLPMNELLELRFSGHVIEEAANVYERVCGRVCLSEIRPSQLVYSGELGPRGGSLPYQIAMNFVVAVIGIVVSSPIMLITALAVKFSFARPHSLSPGARGPEWRAV